MAHLIACCSQGLVVAVRDLVGAAINTAIVRFHRRSERAHANTRVDCTGSGCRTRSSAPRIADQYIAILQVVLSSARAVDVLTPR